jgi:hypothetical protein
MNRYCSVLAGTVRKNWLSLFLPEFGVNWFIPESRCQFVYTCFSSEFSVFYTENGKPLKLIQTLNQKSNKKQSLTEAADPMRGSSIYNRFPTQKWHDNKTKNEKGKRKKRKPGYRSFISTISAARTMGSHVSLSGGA